MDLRTIFCNVLLRLKSFPDSMNTFWGTVMGLFFFVIGLPDFLLYALIGAMAVDTLTRVRAQAVKNGGYIQATKTGAIRSRKMMTGFHSKFLAYFALMVVANMTKHVVPLHVATVFQSVVWGILFVTEAHSCVENVLEGIVRSACI
ncbi:MAG: hypothetical protein FD169_1311 [Bacillota bacterium]|nr:MAG: hypothetical protein FD169_1311 [Bacillota bacterium]